jgi:hypothetical protein
VRGNCGRLTKAGTPCKLPLLWLGGFYTRITYEGGSCSPHATPAERAVYQAALEAIEADERRCMLAYHRSLPVACWEWPVTDEDRRRADAARVCDDPAEARRLAWKLLAGWQQHRCAICGGHARVLDHAHETGLVRGWLCRECNTGEGFGHLPGDRFDRYRQNNPASILGIELRYYSPFTGWAEPEVSDPGAIDRSPGYTLAACLAEN